MGSITAQRDASGDLTVFTVDGAIDADQVLSEITRFLTQEPTQLVIWNLTHGSLAGVPAKDLQGIVVKGAPFASVRKGGRTAIVSPQDMNYGLSRMFQSFAEVENLPFKIRVFRTEREAKAWLSESENFPVSTK